METLSRRDRSSYQSHRAASHRYRSHSPRLPTPETSRSSNDESEGGRGRRRGSPNSELYRRSPETLHIRPPLLHRMSQGHRPSLPPLKTVLGDNMASPPATPRFQFSSVQPSPCEPIYTTSTYKPPSLYPNKKQKTDPPVQPFEPYANANGHAPSAMIDAPPRPGASLPPSLGPLPPKYESRHRDSAIPQISPTTIPHVSGRFPPPIISRPHPGLPYRTPEQTPTTTTFDRPYPFHEPAPPDPGAHMHARPSPIRRPSHDPYGRHPLGPIDTKHARHISHPEIPSSYHNHSALRLSRDYVPPHTTKVYPGSYDAAHAAFLMNGNYDYQHGKARKRSNLPKQSTEIMKQWFDQNLSNPYPSEEQKALFSSATGISMTQVSNWFINHRRRCPELRDKRDKTRRDGDS